MKGGLPSGLNLSFNIGLCVQAPVNTFFLTLRLQIYFSVSNTSYFYFSSDWNGKEIITRYTTDIPSNKTFYTDSNGRRWVKRILNYRSSWNMTVHEPVAGNYYPLTSAIQIRDELNDTATLTVITDRAEGGTSLHDGEIEIMVRITKHQVDTSVARKILWEGPRAFLPLIGVE